VLTAIGKHENVKVYPGASKALTRPTLHAPTTIHGETGLDGTNLLPKPVTPAETSISAVEAMFRALRTEKPGTAWLVTTGAVTNAAQLIIDHPEMVDHLAGFSMMGGAVGGNFTDAVKGEVDGVERIGNWTPYAEFNVLADPEAANLMLSNPELAKKTTVIPLDVTHQVLATKDVQELLLLGPGREKLANGKRGKTTLRVMLVELLMFFAETYK
jgi:uridine nucleosidase